MPDSFFQSDKKRKRTSRAGPSRSRPEPAPRRTDRDEDIPSGSSDAGGEAVDDIDFQQGRGTAVLSDDEIIDENETAREKRVRLAKGYLAKIRDELQAEGANNDYDAAEIDRELIASRLQKEVAESEGRIHSFIAANIGSSRRRFLTTPSHCPTAVAASTSSVFVSTKRGVIHSWSLLDLKRRGKPFGQAREKQSGHPGEILCLAASEDGKWLVSGGRDKVVGIWSVKDGQIEWIRGMRGHKDAVTSVVIPPLNNPSYHILTAALSRHLALASLSTLSVIDTFYGHQDSITDVSALKPTTAVTAGSRDRTCRWWKVEEEVQLVFRGGGRTFEGIKGVVPDERKERLGGGWMDEDAKVAERRQVAMEKQKNGKSREFVEGSIDCVCMVDDQHFVSGGDSGSISLWHTGKKKPIFTHAIAHGVEEELGGVVTPRWITSLAALRGTDLFASGSWDGCIRLWAIEPSLRSFKPVSGCEVVVPGFVNSMQILALPTSSVDSRDWLTSFAEISSGSPTSQVETSQSSDLRGKEIVLFAAVGQEPRLGRWMRLKDGVKNGVLVSHLQFAPRVVPETD